MIKYLQLTNFRRHADVELRFDDDKQLVLIAGANGAGKSTILEGIQFALWGESRHGRRGLQNLVRRGSELEGMSVELVFTIAGEDYRVHRRRDGKSSTAVLYVNDTPLVEGPVTVTEEISRLMGMDSAGFRLAVVAQQKDLDGLASLRPAERAQMVTRLLRLDALTAAKTEASAVFRRERDLAVALRGDDLDALEAEAQAARGEVTVAASELSRSRAALAVLEAELAMTADVESAWVAAAQAVARIDGAITQLEGQLSARTAELAGIVVPEAADAPTVDIAAVSADLSEVERAITVGEAAQRAAAQRASVADELARVVTRLAAVDDALAAPAVDLDALSSSHREAHAAVTGKEADLATLQSSIGGARALVTAASDRLARAQKQDAVCGECGQDVPSEHRASQQMTAISAMAAARDELAALEAALAEGSEELTRLRSVYAQAGDALAAGRHDAADRDRLTGERAELTRRESSYRGQLGRLDEAPVDMDSLYARKGELSLLLASAAESTRTVQLREKALARKDSLRSDVEQLSAELDAKRQTRTAAAPGADLELAYAQRQHTLEARTDEADVVTHWTMREAVLTEQLASVTRRITSAQAQADRQGRHQQQAVHAAAAGRLLADVADRLATQIRPSLEGAVGTLLSQMSGNRFTSVSISADYDILVEDDGQMRPLTELSGGEVDLVALAVRLALAQVVSDRHGAGGAGFLVLDECFGSQDPQRRAAILDALRSLRSTYSQIFLISHVENIEDAADVVVTVATSEDRAETDVTVS